MRMSVIVPDRIIVVDGVVHRCEFEPHAPDLHAIQWDGDRGEFEWKGRACSKFAPEQTGKAYQEASEVVARYQGIWKSADDAARKAVEAAAEKRREEIKQQEDAVAAFKAAQEQARADRDAKLKEQEEARAERQRIAEKQRPVTEALQHLYETDHEVIKAAEAVVAAQGALPPDIVASRAKARAFVRKNRPK